MKILNDWDFSPVRWKQSSKASHIHHVGSDDKVRHPIYTSSSVCEVPSSAVHPPLPMFTGKSPAGKMIVLDLWQVLHESIHPIGM